MSDALDELATINRESASHLREVLDRLGLRLGSITSGGKAIATGNAFFAAFHPIDTCLRFPPLTVRFFQDAVKFGVLGNVEAQEISFQMAQCCRGLRQEYKGAFSATLDNGVFRDFLSETLTINEFVRKESVHGWCADAFAAHFPWPIMADIHLGSAGYRPANLSRKEILTHASGPFLKFMTALDIAVLGAWTGFSVGNLSRALSWLQEAGDQDAEDIVLWPDGEAERLVLPIFSHGFQGAVFGFFSGLTRSQKRELLKTTLHFGQSVADNYASLRRSQCLKTLRRASDPASIASAFLQVVSPVEQLFVERKGQWHGYSLRWEDGYWAGYREVSGMPAADLAQELEFEGKSLRFETRIMGEPIRLRVKPLQDQQSLDPIFTRLSLSARLAEVITSSNEASDEVPISLAILDQFRQDLESRLSLSSSNDRNRGDFGRLKRLCLVELVIENYSRSEVEISNYILKSKLEKKLSPGSPMKINGYQIAGRALHRVQNEFPEGFKKYVKFHPAGPNKVRLSWKCE